MAKKAAKPATVQEYFDSLPDDRRSVLQKVRKTIRDNLQKGYDESVSAGMIVYSVPLSVLPRTYNGQPLWYLALASQKNYMAAYLMPVYGDPAGQKWLQEQFERRGKRLDMGKSCLRFRSLDDLPLDVLGKIAGKFSVEEWVSVYQRSRQADRSSRAGRAAAGTRAGAAKGR